MWIRKGQTYLSWAPALLALALLRASANAILSANGTTSDGDKVIGAEPEPYSISDAEFDRMEYQMPDFFPLDIRTASSAANHSESVSPSQITLNRRDAPTGKAKSSGKKKPAAFSDPPAQERMRYNFNTIRVPSVGQITSENNFQSNSTARSHDGTSTADKIPIFQHGKPAIPNGEGSSKRQSSAKTDPKSNINPKSITSKPRQAPNAPTGKASAAKPAVSSSNDKKPTSSNEPTRNHMRYNIGSTRSPSVGQVAPADNLQSNSKTASKNGVSPANKISLFRYGKSASPNGEVSSKTQSPAKTVPKSNITPKSNGLKPRQAPDKPAGKASTPKPAASSSNESSKTRLKGGSSVPSSSSSTPTKIHLFQHGKPASPTGAVSSKSPTSNKSSVIPKPSPPARPSVSSTSSAVTRTSSALKAPPTISVPGPLKSSPSQTLNKVLPSTYPRHPSLTRDFFQPSKLPISVSSNKQILPITSSSPRRVTSTPLTSTSLIPRPTPSSALKPVMSSSRTTTQPTISLRPASSSPARVSSSTQVTSSKIIPSTVSSFKATKTPSRLSTSLAPSSSTAQTTATVAPSLKSSINKTSSTSISTTSKSVPKATSILPLPSSTRKSIPKATSSATHSPSTTSKTIPTSTSSILPLPSTKIKSTPTSSISSSATLPKTSSGALTSTSPTPSIKPTMPSEIITRYHNTSVTHKRGLLSPYINPGSFSASSTNFIPTRIKLSNKISKIKTEYTNGYETHSASGTFDKSFGKGGLITKWQSSGEFSHGGCDVSLIGVNLIQDCYRMSLSGDIEKHLGDGSYATARQRIEVYVAGVVDSSTWEYSWKAFLATSTTTTTFFHLWQLLTRGGGGLSGPVVTLEALNGKAIVKDSVRCSSGCTDVDINQFSHRLIQHQMIVKYGNEGKIEYQAVDALSGINLLTYNATGFMGNLSTSIKFGLYRRANPEMGPATMYFGDFVGKRID